MVGHSETPRGAIRDAKKISRIRDFTRLRWGNITPTDVDGLLDFYNRAWVIFEAKMGDAMPPMGQRLALEHQADDLARTKPTLLLVLRVPDGAPEPIDYANLVVSASREHGAWENAERGKAAKGAIDGFLARVLVRGAS